MIFRYARDPLLIQFQIAKLFRDKSSLLQSCYPEEKSKGLIKLIDMNVSNLEGDIVECGCYRGGGTIMIAEIIKEKGLAKHIYAFDSFEGLPDPNEKDKMRNGNICYSKGILSDTSLGLVEAKAKFFKVNKIIRFFKGYFQDTIPAAIQQNQKISVLIIDPDQYEGTKFCLEYFYMKMVKGGIVIVDDYSLPDMDDIDTPGVRSATDEFLRDKPEKIIHLAHSMYYFKKQ